MKEFAVGTQYVIDGKVRKVTKVNSKSVYFGRVRSNIQVDEQRDAQFIDVNGCVYYADDSYAPEKDAATTNAEETTTEIKEEAIMTEAIMNVEETTEVQDEYQEAIDTSAVATHEDAAESVESADATPKYTEYVVMKADRKDTTLWWDIVRKQKGENISDIINPLHEADNPKFVALVAVDKVKKYLDDTTIKGMVQTVRDVTKKYAKVSGINTPTEAMAATVFAAIIAAFSDGATEGSWKATPVEDVEAATATEEDAE